MTSQSWPVNVVPVRTVEWEDGRDGAAVLIVPRFQKGLLAKYLQPRLGKRKYLKVSLDELGSFVWRHMDGRNDFGKIVSIMQEKFADKADQTENRLQKFLFILQKNGFASLVVPK